MKMSHIAAALGLAAVTSFASAAVAYDPLTGGFVGKGDVQLAFGWNNAALQKNAAAVSFSYRLSTDYKAVCTWTTGEGTRGEREHNVKHTEVYVVGDTVAYDARLKSQITGFNLATVNLEAAPVLEGTLPVVGEGCPGEQGHDGTWSSVAKVEGSEIGMLSVRHGIQSTDLPNTPVL
ncbi:hypothetical protein [Massilia sp. GCM10023247]|uniref:hypothetical protein n=1 Tax=Massilia sp. GCM10023247 TaxID=3252643 RepID=UPI003620523E